MRYASKFCGERHRPCAGGGFGHGSTAAAANTPTEAANKETVLDFYAALNEADATNSMKERIAGIAEKYLSPEYKQHTLVLPGPGTDREKLIRMFQSRPALPPAGAPAMPPQRTDAVMAEGDRVMLLTSRDQRDPATGEMKPSYIFNMFRVKDGKLVEHWDVSPGMAGLRQVDLVHRGRCPCGESSWGHPRAHRRQRPSFHLARTAVERAAIFFWPCAVLWSLVCAEIALHHSIQWGNWTLQTFCSSRLQWNDGTPCQPSPTDDSVIVSQ